MDIKRQKAMSAYLGKFKEREMENKAVEWDGIDYPPLRCAVEVHNDEGHTLLYGHDVIGRRGEVKSVYTSGIYVVVVVEIDGNGYCFKIGMIRPIKSPKEKAIEEMLEIIMSSSGHAAGLIECINVAKAMYEEGYHK